MEKVTAGIPGLLPSQRSKQEQREKERARQRQILLEHLERSNDTVARDGDVDVTDIHAQLGNPMTSEQVIKRLQIMNRNLMFEVAHNDPSKIGIYILKYDQDDTGWGLHKRFVCGMENGFMPEFSVRHNRIKEVPNPDRPGEWMKYPVFQKETRGWRTVLARLLRMGIIAEPDIYKSFDLGRDSQNWQRMTT